MPRFSRLRPTGSNAFTEAIPLTSSRHGVSSNLPHAKRGHRNSSSQAECTGVLEYHTAQRRVSLCACVCVCARVIRFRSRPLACSRLHTCVRPWKSCSMTKIASHGIRGSTGPFRGHPTMPGNLNSTNPVSSAWETANNGPTGRYTCL